MIAMPYGEMPQPDVVDLLVEQHYRIRDLMADVLATTGEARRTAFRELVRLLSVHETAEEEVVHPVARHEVAAGDAIVDDRLGEERSAKEVLQQLDGMDPDDEERFLPLFAAMREAVLTHAVSEQRYEFSRLRQHLGDEQRVMMRGLVAAAEKAAPTHPHPGVESATANIVVGTPAAIMDRARDAIRSLREGAAKRD